MGGEISKSQQRFTLVFKVFEIFDFFRLLTIFFVVFTGIVGVTKGLYRWKA